MSLRLKVGLLAGVFLLGAIALSLFLFARSGDKSAGGAHKQPDTDPSEGMSGNTLTNSIGMKFVLIQPGTFNMGSPESEAVLPEKGGGYGYRSVNEGPQHPVEITKPFYMGVCEVTQGEFEKGLGFTPSADSKFANYPKTLISWTLAENFCKDLSELPAEKKAGRKYRLPTEAEWEYACRAGSDTPYCFGDDVKQLKEYAWYGAVQTPQDSKSHPVGQLKANAWGLFDMHGNVWELCADWYDANYYKNSPASDPKGPAEPATVPNQGKDVRRVIRGGSYLINWQYGTPADSERTCRSAFRSAGAPNGYQAHIGFRVVCEVVERAR